MNDPSAQTVLPSDRPGCSPADAQMLAVQYRQLAETIAPSDVKDRLLRLARWYEKMAQRSS